MKIKSEILERIIEKYELKKGVHIDEKTINRICRKEKIEIKDLCILLQIGIPIYNRLKNKKQKYAILKFNKYESIKDRKILKKGKIDKEEYEIMKEKMNVKDGTLLRRLGASRYSFNKLKNQEIDCIKIVDVKIRYIVNLIKIDLKYLKGYGNKYYKINELKEICKKRGITLDQFLKYYGKNDKHYKFNKKVVEESSKGIWIGDEEKIPKKFFDKYASRIQKEIKNAFYRVYNNIGNKFLSIEEDLKADALIEIYSKCGNVVRKFYFNLELMFNILRTKARYFIINIYRKKYYYMSNELYYDSFQTNNIDHTKILLDNKNDPQLLFDII